MKIDLGDGGSRLRVSVFVGVFFATHRKHINNLASVLVTSAGENVVLLHGYNRRANPIKLKRTK